MEDKDDVADRIGEYKTFLDEVLKPELDKVQSSRDQTVEELNDYRTLLSRLKTMMSSSKDVDTGKIPNESRAIEVNLGHEMVYCQAEIDRESNFFVHVGMGFQVEFTLPEACRFVQKRIHFLEQVLQVKQAKLKKVEEHLESSSFILEELSKQIGR